MVYAVRDDRLYTHRHGYEPGAAARSNTMTKQYDREAMRYLSWALYPLIGCYAVYALLYETHRSWYSWVLNSLVGAVYTFGFILMCPQARTVICSSPGEQFLAPAPYAA